MSPFLYKLCGAGYAIFSPKKYAMQNNATYAAKHTAKAKTKKLINTNPVFAKALAV